MHADHPGQDRPINIVPPKPSEASPQTAAAAAADGFSVSADGDNGNECMGLCLLETARFRRSWTFDGSNLKDFLDSHSESVRT